MKNLTTGHPLKLIFFFALPLMFGNFLQQLYIMVDTMIVGRFVGVSYHFFTNNYRTFIKTIKYTKSYNSRIYYLFKNYVWWSLNCDLL